MTPMSHIRNLFAKIGLSERRKNRRVPTRTLEVLFRTGFSQKRAIAKDISPTGIYLVTKERMELGTNMLLTLQRRVVFARDPDTRVRLEAIPTRLGEDGVGLMFVHEHCDATAWTRLIGRVACAISGDDAVRTIRITQALAILVKVCPASESDIFTFLTSSLSSDKVDLVTGIVLHAEEMLKAQNLTLRTDVSPFLILDILAYASKADGERLTECWVGLLAASLAEGSDDNASLKYARLLSQVDQVQIRILDSSWTMAIQTGWRSGFALPRTLHCSASEIRKITRSRNMASAERNLNHLYNLNLLEQTIKLCAVDKLQEANLTPTELGMKLHARCTGYLDTPGATEPLATRISFAS